MDADGSEDGTGSPWFILMEFDDNGKDEGRQDPCTWVEVAVDGAYGERE